VNKWDAYFFSIADAARTLSKDESTQLGAVIVGPDREIRSTGYNSFPRGIVDDNPARQVRPEKYLFIEHAERNAIYNAARVGIPLKGCVLYCEWPPCADCARGAIQVGIVEIVFRNFPPLERWGSHISAATGMLKESGVKLRKA
jgi:dCMP deaminase